VRWKNEGSFGCEAVACALGQPNVPECAVGFHFLCFYAAKFPLSFCRLFLSFTMNANVLINHKKPHCYNPDLRITVLLLCFIQDAIILIHVLISALPFIFHPRKPSEKQFRRSPDKVQSAGLRVLSTEC
jgi:hypothetical protein